MIQLAEQSAEQRRASELSPEVRAARARRRKRRLRTTSLVALAVIAMVGTYIPVTLLAPLGASSMIAEKVTVSLPDAAALILPDFGASAISVTGAEQFPGLAETNGILAASGG